MAKRKKQKGGGGQKARAEHVPVVVPAVKAEAPTGNRAMGVYRRLFTETEEDRAQADSFDPPRPFIEHFIELRNCIVRCALAWVVAILVVAPFAPWIIRALLLPLETSGLEERGITLQGLEIGSGFSIFMTTMLWGGTILALPALLYFIFRFVFPGLKRHERNLIRFALGLGVLLFVGGVALCFSFTLPLALDALMGINSWMHVGVGFLTPEPYIRFVLKILLAFGLAFQFPLLLLGLGWIGLMSSATLRKRRGGAIILIFVAAMFLTPPDPLSQVVMAVPMCLLYELTILLMRLRERFVASIKE